MSSVEKIKERLDIVDVVTSYIKLDKAGGNYRARCPFHNEKTPSFFVSPGRNTYHCFGCDRGGDIFSFVEEFEGLDFKGALKVLADKAGVQLVYTNPKVRDEQEKLYLLMEDAATFFQINLTKNKKVLAYLYKRGLKSDTLKNFRVGFAEDSWDSLYNFLKTKGYSYSEMEKGGLIAKKDASARFYDRFRSRIMFPISDRAGRIVAFSGRIFGDTDGENNITVGKYVNSPETVLYNKSHILYGYDKAKNEIRKTDTCILVEGQMDLLMTHQAGNTNSVALSGTAFTEEQIKVIKRLASTLILSLDSDEAGLSASKKGAFLAIKSGLNVKAIAIPDGMDPADIILNDLLKWEKLVAESVHIVDFYIDVISRQEKDLRNFRLGVGKLVLPLVRIIKNKIDQEHFIDKIAKRLSVSKESIREELNKIAIPANINTFENQEVKQTEVNAKNNRRKILTDQIIGILLWQDTLKKSSIPVDKEMERLKNILGSTIVENALDMEDSAKSKMIFNAEIYFDENIKIKDELDELFRNLEKDILKDELEKTSLKLKEAEKNMDNKLASSVLKKFQELSKKINSFK